MVAARDDLLRDVRRMAALAEGAAMRLRGRLVPPILPLPIPGGTRGVPAPAAAPPADRDAIRPDDHPPAAT
ncbi:MAG: hypothetical protein ACKOCW_08685 [Planctomycetaceae bacterium]